MRKRIVKLAGQPAVAELQWLDLVRLVQVEVTSEEPGFPIVAAFTAHTDPTTIGWRAANPGEQAIRLLFDKPQRLRRLQLRFMERDRGRTQEFVLRWSSDGEAYHELLRQQWNFNPLTAISELEDLEVDLNDVSILELRITPDISGGDARASLAALKLA